MPIIDHTTAAFDFNSLTRGYAAARNGSTMVYARKINPTHAHVIVSDREGFWEYEMFSRSSSQHTAESVADDF